MLLMERTVPEPGEAQIDRIVDAAMAHVASNGVTSLHDMGDWRDLAAYRRAAQNGGLITRIYSIMPLADWQRLRDEVAANGRGDAWLHIGGLKGFMDGSLGSHTAAFLEPFTDAADDRGFLINDLDDMQAWIGGADAAGLQVMVHAIGDRAIRDLLDIFSEVAAHDSLRNFEISSSANTLGRPHGGLLQSQQSPHDGLITPVGARHAGD